MKLEPHPTHGGSLYGVDLLGFIEGYESHLADAHDACVFCLTHDGRYPAEHAIEALAPFDRAVLRLLKDTPRPVSIGPAGESAHGLVAIYINNLGRLHLRPALDEKPQYGGETQWVDIGTVLLNDTEWHAARSAVVAYGEREAAAFSRVRAAMDAVDRAGRLAEIVEQVIDHVEHVESVCFYSQDRFFALIDRHVNLIDTKGQLGYLPRLRGKPLIEWTQEETTIVAALHALFLSGRSVRFEEFNGVVLDAQALVAKLHHLHALYESAGVVAEAPLDADLFDVARAIRKQTLQAMGKPWLRYRWIYGLNFQKKEHILPGQTTSESASSHLREFADEYREWVGESLDDSMPEHLFFNQLAAACLARDLGGRPFEVGNSAARGWVEYLMERIVESAVRATGSDYGMSSSIRSMASMVQYSPEEFVRTLHALTPADFFTCFVSFDFMHRVEKPVADTIAASVQKRMMFNRWHFIPGNLDRASVSPSRHWYYPPLIPDIAVYSDIHRSAHNRAMVKFSIRSPGPDMSRPPLHVAGRPFRGFYDVRVVRMAGNEFAPEDMLRTRRRTLWLESVYNVLALHLQQNQHVAAASSFAIKGFQAGAYRDIPRHPC